MKVIADAGHLPDRYRHSVVAIGVFDGVHLGHQAVIGRAVAEARRHGGTSVVVTFYPHPVEVLRPADFAGYVMPLEERLRCIEALGADVCYVITFDKKFAARSAAHFVRAYLSERLRATKVVVGADFCFGGRRAAAADDISRFDPDIAVEKVGIRKINHTNIKTRLIRELVLKGDLASLGKFLGRPYTLFGEVEKGLGLGRKLGFPTANIRKENVVILPSGIYLSWVVAGAKKYPALFYIGSRPTVNKDVNDITLEAHLFDFKGRLYGKKIRVEFIKKVRNDRAFPDEKSLSSAIARDVACARAWFARAAV